MHAVVVDQLPSDPAAAARALAEALGRTAYECRPIANAPQGGPVVVGCHAEPANAEAMAARVRTAGFETTVVPSTIAAPVRGFVVRSFTIGDAALAVHSTEGHDLALRYEDIEGLVRGSEVTRDSQTQTTSTRKLAVGRAVLTGGLMMTRKQKSKQTTTTTDSQGLLVVYSTSASPVAL
nr:hypothetical protein [Deltaproteobacteria bacterium]